jgi:hypothetical protein
VEARYVTARDALPVIEADVVVLLRELVDEVRGLRSDTRRAYRRERLATLRLAIAGFLGDGPFNVRGLLEMADDCPAIGDALADLLDMNASDRARATALGMLLARDPHFERVNERDGAPLYRLAPDLLP